MAEVKFEDFSVQVKGAIDAAVVQWLEEASSEIMSQAMRNSVRGKVDGGTTIGSWKHVVNESMGEAIVGNTQENAIWEELGTGEYALEGKGRKGGWYIPIGNGKDEISQAVVDAYHMKVVHGKDGKKFAFTKGKKPKRMLHTAFTKNKQKIIHRAEQIFGEGLK